MEIVEMEGMNKKLGGEKRKNENEKQSVSIVGSSNRAVLGVLDGYTCDCC
jgi:hypothetical protein